MGRTISEKFAGFWLRLAAYLIDLVLLWVPCSLFRWLFEQQEFSVQFELLDLAQVILLCSLYYGFLESSKYQGTVGKIVLRLRVTDMWGNRILWALGAAQPKRKCLSSTGRSETRGQPLT